jgi:hypothetical protein
MLDAVCCLKVKSSTLGSKMLDEGGKTKDVYFGRNRIFENVSHENISRTELYDLKVPSSLEHYQTTMTQ